MAIQIEVLSKKIETKPTAKGSYQQLELAYKNLTFQGKVEGRKVMSFGNTAAAFKELSNASTGDVYDIDVVKNEKTGYNDWVSAKKSVGGAQPAQAQRGTAVATSATTIKNTYETPEERAKKQIYIVRQSSLSTAADLLSVGAKSPAKAEDVIDLARKFEGYVFGDSQADIASDVLTPPALPEDLNDDIPM